MFQNFYIYTFLVFQTFLFTWSMLENVNELSTSGEYSFVDTVEILLPPRPEDFDYLISGGNRDKEVLRLSRFLISLRTSRSREFFGDNHFCMGTIIGKRVVLTACHCVME